MLGLGEKMMTKEYPFGHRTFGDVVKYGLVLSEFHVGVW